MILHLIGKTRRSAVVGGIVVARVGCVRRAVLLSACSCSSCRLAVIRRAVESIIIARYVLLTEIEHKSGIESHAAKTCLEVKVRTRASSSVTTETDNITGANLLILIYELLREVSVDSLQTVVMSDDDILTVSSALVSYNSDFS